MVVFSGVRCQLSSKEQVIEYTESNSSMTIKPRLLHDHSDYRKIYTQESRAGRTPRCILRSPIEGRHTPYNNAGLISKVSEEIATENVLNIVLSIV